MIVLGVPRMGFLDFLLGVIQRGGEALCEEEHDDLFVPFRFSQIHDDSVSTRRIH